jgi:cyclopropane fatty-acyl-phospholipid synthase-like methyltransferase
MLGGANRVLEIGCQDGFTSLYMSRYVQKLVAVDFFPQHIEDAKKFIGSHASNIEFSLVDIVKTPVVHRDGIFNAGFSLDVLEHIDPIDEPKFFKNVLLSLSNKSVFIIGMPSLESQEYASANSKIGHVNCKSGDSFKKTCEQYFNYVFLFSMNDEVVHTGFFPMAHYLIAVCCDPK